MTSHDIWYADFHKLADALKPYVIRLGDEGLFLSPDAPDALSRPYGALLSMGYANGWL